MEDQNNIEHKKPRDLLRDQTNIRAQYISEQGRYVTEFVTGEKLVFAGTCMSEKVSKEKAEELFKNLGNEFYGQLQKSNS